MPATPTFGPCFDPTLDEERLQEQAIRIYRLMNDSEWRTLGEISAVTGDPESSVSAQLRHLRKPEFGSFVVDKRRRGLATSGLWEYRLLPPGSPTVSSAPISKARRNPFLEGMKHAARIVIAAGDLSSAKSRLRDELLKVHSKGGARP